MSLTRFPKNDCKLKSSSYLQEVAGVEDWMDPDLKKPTSLNFVVPGQIPPRKGKKIATFAIIAALCYGVYSVWNIYFRYESHGVAVANTVGIYSPIEGMIEYLNVSDGDKVSKGAIVAKIVNSDDQRALMKINDEIQVTKAEIVSKQSETRWSFGRNNDTFYEAAGELTSEEGQLAELKAKLILQKANLTRIKFLKTQGAVSQLDLDKAQADYDGTRALINGKTNTINAMRDRLAKSNDTITDTGEAQVTPLQQKLTFLENEKSRIEQKIEEGNIRSPVDGIVSSIEYHAGERVKDNPIFNIIENDTTKLVLYYNPSTRVPQPGESVDIWSPSLGQTLSTVVSAISKDTTNPPDQIKKNYPSSEKLIKVFLTPHDKDVNSFIVGSTIKRPNVIESVIGVTQIAQWVLGSNAIAGDGQ